MGRKRPPVPSVRLQSAKNASRGPCARRLRSCFCCCCNSFSGVLDLISDPATKEFALAFIIGDVFGKLCYAVVTEFITPCFRSVPPLTTSGWAMEFID